MPYQQTPILNITKTVQPSMSTKSFDLTFRKSLYILQRAANREVDLEYDYPKIYKKVKKFYINEDYQFSGIPDQDYETVLNLIGEELAEKSSELSKIKS